MFLMTSCRLGHTDEYGYWRSGPDSVDQISVKFNVRYEGKTVKYCRITCSPINAVGDFVACTVTGKIEVEVTITGPITSGDYEWTYDGWYNSNINDVWIENVVLQYMDGSTQTITGKKIVEDMCRLRQLKEQEKQLKAQQQWLSMSAFERWASKHPFLFFLSIIGEILLLITFLELFAGK